MKRALVNIVKTIIVAVAVVIMIAIATVCFVYSPWGEKLIAEKGSDYLSEMLHENVSIDHFQLDFPLSIVLEGLKISSIDESAGSSTLDAEAMDLALDAGKIRLDVALAPLLKKMVLIENLRIDSTDVNTGSLIAAMNLDARITTLSNAAKPIAIDLDDLGNITVPKLLLRQSEIDISLNDSVPEDTTESEAVLHTLTFSDISLVDVGGRVDTLLDWHLEQLNTDLTMQLYPKLRVQSSGLNAQGAELDVGPVMHDTGLGIQNISDINLVVDSLLFESDSADIDLDARISSLSAKIDNGFCLSNVCGKLALHNGYADVSGMRVETPTSTISLDAGADVGSIIGLEKSGGASDVIFNILCDGHISKGDIELFTDLSIVDPKILSALGFRHKNDVVEFHVKGAGSWEQAAGITMQDTEFWARSGGFKVQGSGVKMVGSKIQVPDLRVDIAGASMDIQRCMYNTATEAYDIDLSVRNLVVNQYVDIPEPAMFTGHVVAKGRGLDFSRIPSLVADLDLDIDYAMYGDYQVENTHLCANLDRGLLDADIDNLLVVISDTDTIATPHIDLAANIASDSTSLEIESGDFSLSLDAQSDYEHLISRFTEIADAALSQLSERRIDAEALKDMMPEVQMTAIIGDDNILMQMLRQNDILCDTIFVDLATSPDFGIKGDVLTHNISAAGFLADTITLKIDQNDEGLLAHTEVKVPEEMYGSPFTGRVDIGVEQNQIRVRAKYIDKDNITGLDLGLRAQAVDSTLCCDIYPFDPIIAYRQFAVSDTNYINLHKKNRVFADVDIESTADSSCICITGNPSEDELQHLTLGIRNLDLDKLTDVLPFLSDMKGCFGGDVDFIQQMDYTFALDGLLGIDQFAYSGINLGDIRTACKYIPTEDGDNWVQAAVSADGTNVAIIEGVYDGTIDADVKLLTLPLPMIGAIVDNPMLLMTGTMDGDIHVEGPVDTLLVDGSLKTHDVHLRSDIYSYDFHMDDDTLLVTDSKLTFDQFRIYSIKGTPLVLQGDVDFSNFSNVTMNIRATARNMELLDAQRTRQSALFGKAMGDIALMVRGSITDMRIGGKIKLLNSTDLTYILSNTPLSLGYQLDDIVTFVDFSQPPSEEAAVEHKTVTGMNVSLSLEIEDGVSVKCIYSADEKSYIDVIGGGTLNFTMTPEGVTQLLGRYTVMDGVMKYTNSVIPMKTLNLTKDSYVEFTGDLTNPTLNVSATEDVRASVSNDDGSSRMVSFKTGLQVSDRLSNMALLFTITAPSDMKVQNELAGMSDEEKNKLAVTMLATGMYLSESNKSGYNASNAMNQYLQAEINNIAGKALSSTLGVDMNVGMESSQRADGTSKTDYSFKFTKKFFSDRLNVVIGGMVNTSESSSASQRSGTYIDDVSLEWRLDDAGTSFLRLFHDIDRNNLIEGDITENGAGLILRRKLQRWSELWKLFKFK